MGRGWKGLILFLGGNAMGLGSIVLSPNAHAGMNGQQVWHAMPVLFRLVAVAGFVCCSYGMGMLLGALLSRVNR